MTMKVENFDDFFVLRVTDIFYFIVFNPTNCIAVWSLDNSGLEDAAECSGSMYHEKKILFYPYPSGRKNNVVHKSNSCSADLAFSKLVYTLLYRYI